MELALYILACIVCYAIGHTNGSIDKQKFTMQDGLLGLDKVTRLEIISDTRDYVNHSVSNCKVSLQDKEKTLKVFITK